MACHFCVGGPGMLFSLSVYPKNHFEPRIMEKETNHIEGDTVPPIFHRGHSMMGRNPKKFSDGTRHVPSLGGEMP